LPVWPTVQIAVFPATTPESATDFLTLETGAGVGVGSLMGGGRYFGGV
jgi:hypothetical protein